MKLSEDILDKAKKIIYSPEFSKEILKINENVEEKINKSSFKFFKDEEINFDENLCKEFISFCLSFLKITDKASELTVVISSDKEKFKTFAFYNRNDKMAAVVGIDRNILDVFRSLAHELIHFKQDIKNEITDDQVSDDNDGVDIENEANSLAGVIMRKYGRKHPELY